MSGAVAPGAGVLGVPVPVPPLEAEVGTWRPLRVDTVGGWAIGRSAGFTRRANSVVPAGAVEDAPSALDRAEALYREEGLACVVRVCAAAQPADLDGVLAARGYRAVARTHLMVRPVDGGGAVDGFRAADRRGAVDHGSAASVAGGGIGVELQASDRPDDDWLAGWLAVKASAAAQGDVVGTARRVVTGSPADYVTARDGQGVVGVVRAATAGAWCAVSCLMVAPSARRRGVASTLTEAALERARARGASWAFVQVEETNAAARALYEGFGFERVAAYHYRERTLTTA
ncbi:N-acetyltransferase [Actinotalea sp. Marseille-Q4924]|uniref:GNAT family N-acetyltransferase n=1 Tax=Actinotalea sp. Marseille-Q4924 TaxID=2866571 RepID=UPI001CE40971|nr:GNAT family N-acetyltransferase [Actinotalea sp. Marseille-Q4924]